jgi:hypothetical protein
MGRRSPNAGRDRGAHPAGGHAGGRDRHAHHLPAHPDATQPLDQALVTGISTALHYSFAALVQDSIEALALRGGVRTAGWWLSATGLSGAAIGVLQELTGRRRRPSRSP